MPAIAYLAQFRRHYADGSLYQAARYRTRDHVIPFGAFWIYFREIPVNVATERLSEMRAIANAIGLSFGKQGSGLPDAVREDLTAARLER